MKLAVITARGGSKRIPRKNIREFCGKPIIAYSIEAALNSHCFDEVMVSTDDEEIARIAREYGAIVPFMRSTQTANDFATTADALLEVVCEYQTRKVNIEYLCCLYPTAPFITVDNLISAFDVLKKNKMDVVFPVAKFSAPIQRALRLEDNKLFFLNKKHALTRSQDLEPAYYDSGQFYWVCVESFMKNKSLHSKKSGAIVLAEWQAQDIDHIDDWVMAEIKYALIQQKKNA